MQNFLAQVIRNLSHIFSLVGILLTIYFSVFYVPKYSEEIKIKRIEGVHKELISTIQEFVYNKHKIEVHDLETLIKGKELRDNIQYPYTITELLVQVQETFVSNRFIPLESRKKFIESIDEVRRSINNQVIQDVPLRNIDAFSLLDWSSIIFGILASILGIVSVYTNKRRELKGQIDDLVNDQKEIFQKKIQKAVWLEDFVGRKLELMYGADSVIRESGDNLGVDFMVKKDGNAFFAVEVKFTDTDLIPLRTINQIAFQAKNLKCPLFLVTNATLTKNAKLKFDELNRHMGHKAIYVISVDEIEEVQRIMNSIT